MAKVIFIAGTGAGCGLSLSSFGVLRMLSAEFPDAIYFKPVSRLYRAKDMDIEAARSKFNLKESHADLYAADNKKARLLVEKGLENELLDAIIKKYEYLEKKYGAVVVQGPDFFEDNPGLACEMNLMIAKALGLQVILVIDAALQVTGLVAPKAMETLRRYTNEGIAILAIIINKALTEQAGNLKAMLRAKVPPGVFITVIPWDPKLAGYPVKELKQALDARVIAGKKQLGQTAGVPVSAGMAVADFIKIVGDYALVITPGDRYDILFAAILANESKSCARVSAIILTDGLQPDKAVIKLLKGLGATPPILLTRLSEIQTFEKVVSKRFLSLSSDDKKIELAIALFMQRGDVKPLMQALKNATAPYITPHIFKYRLVEQGQRYTARIVLPEATDARILAAASRLAAMKLATVVLLGDSKAIKVAAKSQRIKLVSEHITIIDPLHSNKSEGYAGALFRMRRSHGVSMETARELVKDPSYFGTMMVYSGDAEGMVSGAVNTTAQAIRPALQLIKTRRVNGLVSSVFFMCLPNRVVVFSDCAVNPDPTAPQLADIAMAAADNASVMGIIPKVAMLSYSSGISGAGPDVDKVRQAVAIVRKDRPDIKIDGPMQYDTAVNIEVGHQKLPDSEVAGQATVFVFPDLDSGNTIYKAVQREAGGSAIGPILLGLDKPVNDLSRGCTAEEIFYTVLITCIQAGQSASPDEGERLNK